MQTFLAMEMIDCRYYVRIWYFHKACNVHFIVNPIAMRLFGQFSQRSFHLGCSSSGTKLSIRAAPKLIRLPSET